MLLLSLSYGIKITKHNQCLRTSYIFSTETITKWKKAIEVILLAAAINRGYRLQLKTKQKDVKRIIFFV